MMLPPGSDCQRWAFTVLNHLQKSFLGWIDVPPMAALRDHMPSRERPRGVFHSTVYTMCNLEELDSADYSRSSLVDAESLFPSISSVPSLTPTTESVSASSGPASTTPALHSTSSAPALNADTDPEQALELEIAKRLQKLS